MAVCIKAVNRYLHNFDDVMEKSPDDAKENEIQSVIRLTKDWLNDTLEMTVLASAFGDDFQSGAFQRYSLSYDITDNGNTTGGVLAYQSGDTMGFETIGRNDRLYCEAPYNF